MRAPWLGATSPIHPWRRSSRVVALTLFGPSMAGVRLFSTLAQAIALVLAG